MRARWSEARRSGWEAETDEVLRHIRDHGAACSADVGGDEKKNSSGWWNWHPSKTALEFLWRSGKLAVCHRQGFRKFYDLSERVIPAAQLNSRMDQDEIIERAMTAVLLRLGFGTSGELAAFFDIDTPGEAKVWCAQTLAAGDLIDADVEMADGRLRRSFVAEETLEIAWSLPEPSNRVRLLSPFDPLLRDRARAERPCSASTTESRFSCRRRNGDTDTMSFRSCRANA